MIAEVEDRDGVERLMEGDVRCGDYCDTCGDCLYCSPHDEEDWCVTGGRWVLYDGMDDARIAELRPYQPGETG